MNDRADDGPSRHPVAADEVEERLRALRNEIDRLDEQIVALLNDRAKWALQLGSLKHQVGMDTYQPEREIAVLEHAREVNVGPLEAGAITRLFERIIDENRRLERQAETEE